MSQALLISDPVPTVSIHDGRPATTSLEVAAFFGKRHNVCYGTFAIFLITALKSSLRAILRSVTIWMKPGVPSPCTSFTATASCCWSWAIRARRPSPSSWRTLRRSTRWRRSLPGRIALPCQRAAAHAGNPCRPSPALFPDRASTNGLSSTSWKKSSRHTRRCRRFKSGSCPRRTG